MLFKELESKIIERAKIKKFQNETNTAKKLRDYFHGIVIGGGNMDINDLIVNKDIYTLRDTAISKAEELKDLIEQIIIQMKPKVVKKTNEIFEQFVIYFKAHGFNLTSPQERVRIAKNELYSISLVINKMSDSTATFRFEIPRKSISHAIEIRLNKETENLIRLRNSLGSSFNPEMLFNGSYKKELNTIFP